MAQILGKPGIRHATYYNWKSKYGEAGITELTRFNEIETGNAKLKRMYADMALANAAIEDPVPKAVTPSAKREGVWIMSDEMRLPVSRACAAARLSRAAWYRPVTDAGVWDGEIVAALNELVGIELPWGFWNCFERLRQMGHRWNHKRVYRNCVPVARQGRANW